MATGTIVLGAFVFATRGRKDVERLGQLLPHEPVNALVESADREGWWVVGTDGGAYVTADGGASFATLHRDLPNVPVHDLVIQERANELVLGTRAWHLRLGPRPRHAQGRHARQLECHGIGL